VSIKKDFNQVLQQFEKWLKSLKAVIDGVDEGVLIWQLTAWT